MAGCAGSGTRRQLIAAALLVGVACTVPAQTPASAQANADPRARPAAAPPQQGKIVDKHTKGSQPDAALIEYLGEFGDAADGLDAMGLSDTDAARAKPADGHRR